MAVHDPTDVIRTADGRQIPMSEHTIVVATGSDRPVERWVGDDADREVAVVGPERGTEFGLEPDGGTVVASVDPADGTVDVAQSTRLGAPLDRADLLETIDRLERRVRYDALLAEYARLAARRGGMEAGGEVDLAENRQYRALRRRLANVEAELDELTHSFDGRDFRAAFEAGGFGAECGRAD